MSENILDIYPLSPMQQGMLFHSIYSSDSEMYTEQLACKFIGKLNTEAFQKAWQQVVQRHDTLRTAFVWEDLDEPLQAVYEEAELPFILLDWQEVPENEREQKFKALLESERKEGLELSEAPLMRNVLIKLNENETYFIWNHHHLLFDGWGLPLILQEVFKFYDAQIQKKPLQLHPLRPYKDYIAWLQEQDMEKAEHYWKKRLAGFTAPTPLVTARQLSKGTAAYGREKHLLSKELTQKLNTLSREHQITLNTVVQGAWALLSATYSREDDVLFGSTVSGRPADLPGVETMLGLFINTLPVRVFVDRKKTLLEWLSGLQLQTAEARQYEYTPLVNIHSWSDVPGNMPLFNTLIIFENYPVNETLSESEGSLKITDVHSFERTNYPITLIAANAKQFFLEIAYEADTFSLQAIRQMLHHLEKLLTIMATHPNQSVGGIRLLTKEEEQLVLHTWNCKTVPFPEEKTIHRLFEDQVNSNPDVPAVDFEHETLTYTQLNKRANRLAHFLIRKGVRPETIVGLSFNRSIDMVVAVLAVLKAGGAYVPIDPEYPRERIEYMVADSDIRILVTEAQNSALFSDFDLQIFSVDDAKTDLEKESDSNPESNAEPHNLAYVIYTSGSTGKPKGVMLQHRGAANLFMNMQQSFLLKNGKSFLQLASFSFDAATGEIFAALLSGATVQMISKETLLSVDKLVSFLNDKKVTCATIPPSLLSLLPEDKIDSFETIFSVGDACTQDLANRWNSKVRFFNGYGPTEGTVGAIWGIVEKEETTSKSASIGRPIGNVKIYLLDDYLNPVPPGIPGEIHIGGPGVARGYFNRPHITAEKFIPDAFSGISGARLYKTGDLAKHLPDGRIEFIGRVDFQVKIRGFRIELGELEAQLTAIDSIKDAVVTAIGEQAGEKSIVAYLIANDEKKIEPAEIRQTLRETLPDYMVPAAFVVLDTFPLTPNGKVNRKALPAPDQADLTGNAYTAPRTPEEELLAALWADVLNLEKVGVESSFFDLGGHSLLATQLISRVRDAFDVDIELRSLFEAPTIAQLAQEIDRVKKGGSAIMAPPIVPVDRNQLLPLSFSQQRLWFLDQLEPNSPVYNIPTALKLAGPLDVDALEKSIREIIKRHESLRTVFAEEGGKPRQIINDTVDFRLEQTDLSPLPEAHRNEELKRLAEKDALSPFNLSTGPLFRAQLIKLENELHAVLFNMHHIIADGWSSGIIMNEMVQFYSAFSEGQPALLPPLEIQYPDFAFWQQNWLQGEVLKEQTRYWKEKLTGAPPLLELPTDRPRPAVQTFNGASESIELGAELSSALNKMSKEEGATLFMTLLASYTILLHRYSGQDDILTGTPIAGRTRSNLEKIIGFFVNTLIMRNDLSGNPEFTDLLMQVRETALGAYAHQDMPFEKLVEELQPRRDLSHSPLFQTAFVLQNIPADRAVRASDLTLEPLSAEGETAKYDLTLTMAEGADQIVGSMEYNTDLFDASTVRRMLRHFKTIMEAVTADPEIPIDHISLLEEKEQENMLLTWNETDKSFPPGKTVQALFEENARLQPDAPAVVFKKHAGATEEVLTYAQLNRQANQIANYLRSLDVREEDIIGICMDRSLNMVAAMLAIQKAGAAYVPIDPAYPTERIEYMVQDAGLKYLLTQVQFKESLTAHADKLIVVNATESPISEQSGENPETKTNPDNLAYIIYTSGSTGKPKGTLLHHRGACNLAFIQKEAFKVGPGSRILQFASLSFDAATWEFLMAMVSGSTLVLTSTETITSGQELVHFLDDQKITTVTLPPSVLAVLPKAELKQLQTIITAGEAVSGELVEEWGKGRIFFNAYGPTETTVCASMHQCRGSYPAGPPIGKANSNFKLYVLDSYTNPLPVGVPGELCVSGIGLARGYHNRPDLTAEKFIPNPFSNIPGDRLYRTGDRVRYLADGNVEYLGRMDHQVKVRGFRIELGEIEAVLAKHPHIVDQFVMVREDKPGDKRLTAYVVSDGTEEPNASTIKAFVRQTLPEYMTPSAVVFMDTFPLTPNGKINRNLLPAPELSRSDLSAEYVAPRNETEEKLVAIITELLDVKQAGVHDNFFELGGHSLLATQFMSRLKETFSTELPLRTLFEKPTTAQIAEEIRAVQTDEKQTETTPAPEIKRVSRSGRRVRRSDLGK